MKKQNGELICVMANQIAESRHKLSVLQQRLVLWLVAQIEPQDKDFLTHALELKEFEVVMGTKSGRLYEHMKSASTGLLQSILEIKEPGERSGVRFQWFSEVKYHDGTGTLTVRFHERLRPLLLELKSRFTQLALSQALKLRSGYAIRFYELLSSRERLKRFEMTIEEFRQWAGLEPGEMTHTFDLRRFVIDLAKRELDAKADLSFDVEPVRVGRSVVAFAFKVRKNKPRKPAQRVAEASESSPEGEHRRKTQKAALADLRASLARTPAPSSLVSRSTPSRKG